VLDDDIYSNPISVVKLLRRRNAPVLGSWFSVLLGLLYTEHGVFRRGERAASQLLAGFSVYVNEVFNAK
jgi:hypothetical protein